MLKPIAAAEIDVAEAGSSEPAASSHSPWFRLGHAALLCLTLAASCLNSGCSRTFWRTQADFDSYNILFDRTCSDPRWAVPRVWLAPDPRSRLFDPYDPDRPPLPPDDLAANESMQVVSGIRGYRSWHKFGQAMAIENPQWMENLGVAPRRVQGDAITDQFALGVNENVAQASATASDSSVANAKLDGAPPAPRTDEDEAPLVPAIRNLTLSQAVELANIHSRDYQTQIENVFLSALDLTFEQFQFQIRYLGVVGREPNGSLTYLNTPSTSDNLQLNTRFGVRKLLPSGGQMAAELANNTLWLFSGPNQTNSLSVLSYSLVQPLFLGAGRKLVLENLTRAERQVLYDVRTLARFRRIFFADVVANGPGAGYLGQLRTLQQIANLRENIENQRLTLDRLRQQNSTQSTNIEDLMEAWPEGLVLPADLEPLLVYHPDAKKLVWQSPRMTDAEFDRLHSLTTNPDWRRAIRNLYQLQLDDVMTLEMVQIQSQLNTQENQLRNNERAFADTVDQFKQLLGLPPDLQVTVDTRLLKPFELYDPVVTVLERTVFAAAAVTGDFDADDPQPKQLLPAIDRVEELIRDVRKRLVASVKSDLERVTRLLPERLAGAASQREKDDILVNLERDQRTFQNIQTNLEDMEARLVELRTYANSENPNLELWESVLKLLGLIRESLLQQVQTLRLAQNGLRAELIRLADFEMTQDDVVATALANRLDLMNSRARVMDARRQLEVAANALQGVVDVVAAGDIRSEGNSKPFDFRGKRSSFRVGLQFTAPIDQIAERNNYREALIAYQRSRRTYMQLEDQVKFDVRAAWRQLRVLRRNFETARQNLRYSQMQVDQTIETLNAVTESTNVTGGAGLSGLNVLNAYQRILASQNELIQIWVDYERNRINIHRDMDIMEVDESGLWVDPVYQTALPVALPQDPAAHDIPPQPSAEHRRARPEFAWADAADGRASDGEPASRKRVARRGEPVVDVSSEEFQRAFQPPEILDPSVVDGAGDLRGFWGDADGVAARRVVGAGLEVGSEGDDWTRD